MRCRNHSQFRTKIRKATVVPSGEYKQIGTNHLTHQTGCSPHPGQEAVSHLWVGLAPQLCSLSLCGLFLPDFPLLRHFLSDPNKEALDCTNFANLCFNLHTKTRGKKYLTCSPPQSPPPQCQNHLPRHHSLEVGPKPLPS